MKTHALALTVGAAALLSLSACNNKNDGSGSGPNAQTPKAEKAAGDKTIASGLRAERQVHGRRQDGRP